MRMNIVNKTVCLPGKPDSRSYSKTVRIILLKRGPITRGEFDIFGGEGELDKLRD